VRRAAAGDIAAESDRMSRLVDRMLTLARADSGLQLVLTPLELRTLVTEVCRQAGAVHADRNIVVDAVDASVAGDEDALRQLLWILLDNALRHSRSRISVQLAVDGDWARLMVGDDGAGIAPEARDRVFERFYKVDAARTKVDGASVEGGAGLGLAIARWITDQHRGRIIAAGSRDGGAGLFVDLPLLRHS
jgi:two-component system, OmpR family, sensor kinase